MSHTIQKLLFVALAALFVSAFRLGTPPVPQVAITCNIVTGVVTGPVAGPCPTSVCDGVADDASTLAAFNAWAVAAQGDPLNSYPVRLTIPAGSDCYLQSGAPNNFTRGIMDFVLIGYGAEIKSSPAGGFEWNSLGMCSAGINFAGGCSARIDTVSAGATVLTVKDAALMTRFTVGLWVVIGGLDDMGFGSPPNNFYFDYAKVTAISSTTITIDRALTHDYLDTWPLYNDGNASQYDQGGPATVWAMPSVWGATQEYQGLVIDQGAAGNQNARGFSTTFRDVTYLATGGNQCAIPTQNYTMTVVNSDFSACVIEADKWVKHYVIDNSTFQSVNYQSGGTEELLTVTNSTFNGHINGGPNVTRITDTFLHQLAPGAQANGRSDEVVCTRCTIDIFDTTQGVLEPNLIASGYTMAGGVITIPSNQVGRWAVPGSNVFFRGAQDTDTLFQVFSVTQSGSDTLVQTSLSGGFPPIPRAGGGELSLLVHPAPKFTCISCVPGPGADAANIARINDLNQAPPASPVNSYSKRTYTQANLTGTGIFFPMWGNVTSFGVDVTVPYLGPGALTLGGTSQFGNYPTIKASDYSEVDYGPVYNMIHAGNRVTTASGVTGAQSGDTGLAFPETSPMPPWFTQDLVAYLSTDVTGLGTFSVTVTIQTDQGVVNP